MLCCAMLCYAVLCGAVLCCAVLGRAVRSRDTRQVPAAARVDRGQAARLLPAGMPAVPCCVLCHAMPCCMRCHAVPCCMRCHAVPCCMLCHAVPCCMRCHAMPCCMLCDAMACCMRCHAMPASLPQIHCARVARVALWLVGEYCVEAQEVPTTQRRNLPRIILHLPPALHRWRAPSRCSRSAWATLPSATGRRTRRRPRRRHSMAWHGMA